MLRVFILAIAVLVAPLSSEATAQGKKLSEQLTYYSANVDFFRDILAGRHSQKNVKLTGRLELPASNGPVPVVIFQHGSGSPKNRDTRAWREALRNTLFANGIGVFTADSFGGRGIRGTGSDQSQLSDASRVLDSLSALEVVANHPRVDAKNVGVIGFSLGGYVAHLTSYGPVADAVLPNGPRFAAHVGMYSSCVTKYRSYRPTGAPVLFLLGEADDFTPAADCVALERNMERGGGRVETKIYPGAHHGFIGRAAPKFNPKVFRFGDCEDEVLERDGNVSGPVGSSKAMSSWSQYIRTLVQSGCLERGATSGGNKEAAAQSLRDAATFFVRHLK